MTTPEVTPELGSALLTRGRSCDAPAWIALHAGCVTAQFDPAEGWLRRLRVGELEVLTAVYGAVRDRNWGTVPPRLEALHIDQREERFHVSFEVRCVSPAAGFCWQGEVTGDADGTVTFRFLGEAMIGFWKNRIGLCALHPLPTCAGRPCQIETADGAVSEAEFPRLIAPLQPFTNVRAITYEIAPALRVEVRFEGDVFETEDQRNWTDASFKTYSTPLNQPFPVWVDRGTRVEQTVTVRLLETAALFRRSTSDVRDPEINTSQAIGRPLPPIGFCLPSSGIALTEIEASRLKQLRPAHLRVDLRLYETDWLTRWHQACMDAAAVGTSLHAALFLSDEGPRELRALAAELAARPAPVSLWLVFHKNEPATRSHWVRMAEAALPSGATFASGTDANFAELNRSRPGATETSLTCFSINPQVHAFDEASLIENLGAQAATIESARAFSHRPLVVSPITLRPRFNAVATSDTASKEGDLPTQVDPRQMSLLGAAWTVGSLARLAPLEAVHSLTYFETTGWRGLMESERGSPLPDLFPSWPGCVYPMFHLFSWLADAAGVVETKSTDPLRLDGVCVTGQDGRRRWIVANLTEERQRVRVNIAAASAMVSILDETNVHFAMRAPETLPSPTRQPASSGSVELELSAYALTCITPEA